MGVSNGVEDGQPPALRVGHSRNGFEGGPPTGRRRVGIGGPGETLGSLWIPPFVNLFFKTFFQSLFFKSTFFQNLIFVNNFEDSRPSQPVHALVAVSFGLKTKQKCYKENFLMEDHEPKYANQFKGYGIFLGELRQGEAS
jgi:hypothetical protein